MAEKIYSRKTECEMVLVETMTNAVDSTVFIIPNYLKNYRFLLDMATNNDIQSLL